jgi:F0F1-type ATP synthase membrane subunit a
VLLATLLIFSGTAISTALSHGGWGANGSITLISVIGAFGITFLELFVAVLQAFVFMFLIAVFISLMDHQDEHGHEHEHGHATGHEHAHA